MSRQVLTSARSHCRQPTWPACGLAILLTIAAASRGRAGEEAPLVAVAEVRRTPSPPKLLSSKFDVHASNCTEKGIVEGIYKELFEIHAKGGTQKVIDWLEQKISPACPQMAACYLVIFRGNYWHDKPHTDIPNAIALIKSKNHCPSTPDWLDPVTRKGIESLYEDSLSRLSSMVTFREKQCQEPEKQKLAHDIIMSLYKQTPAQPRDALEILSAFAKSCPQLGACARIELLGDSGIRAGMTANLQKKLKIETDEELDQVLVTSGEQCIALPESQLPSESMKKVQKAYAEAKARIQVRLQKAQARQQEARAKRQSTKLKASGGTLVGSGLLLTIVSSTLLGISKQGTQTTPCTSPAGVLNDMCTYRFDDRLTGTLLGFGLAFTITGSGLLIYDRWKSQHAAQPPAASRADR